MYFVAAATDYDGTIAHHGSVNAETISTLTRLRASGRHLILVTGRELPDLRRVFADLALFDRIVAENGALLYVPETDEERALAPEPPAAMVQRLHEAKVEPLSVGRAIIATWEPNETAVLEAIRDLGLEMQTIFNKGAVMVLPAGITKATGLAAALGDLGISPLNVIGFGDAEMTTHFCALAAARSRWRTLCRPSRMTPIL
jgi:HAD superfamily hydrolase (TIGR01484 family)